MPLYAPSVQRDPGDDRKVISASGGGEGADVADGRGAGHDLVDPGHREGGGEAEGDAPLGHVQVRRQRIKRAVVDRAVEVAQEEDPA